MRGVIACSAAKIRIGASEGPAIQPLACQTARFVVSGEQFPRSLSQAEVAHRRSLSTTFEPLIAAMLSARFALWALPARTSRVSGSGAWLAYKQWAEAGAQVRKGEVATCKDCHEIGISRCNRAGIYEVTRNATYSGPDNGGS
jgi:hypothetical protein